MAEPRLHKLILGFSATFPYSQDRYSRDRLDRVSDRGLRERLRFMPSRDPPACAEKLQNRAWEVLEPMVKPRSEERNCLNLVQQIDLWPDLLIGAADDLTERLWANPALR